MTLSACSIISNPNAKTNSKDKTETTNDQAKAVKMLPLILTKIMMSTGLILQLKTMKFQTIKILILMVG